MAAIEKTKIGGLALLKTIYQFWPIIGHGAGTAIPTITEDIIDVCVLFPG